MRGITVPFRRLGDSFDRATDSLTTFRLLLYILLFYLAAACVLAYEHKVAFSIGQILASAGVLIAAAKLSNLIFARLFSVPINHESDLISGLILTFVLTPAKDANGYLVLVAAASVAMLSKYVISWRGRHIFNPAAAGAFISGLVFHHYASWWIGNTSMAAVLIIGGFLITRKMRRFGLVLSFIALYLFFVFNRVHSANSSIEHLLYLYTLATPLLFFSTIMLTEPITSPNRQRNLLIFSAATAIFYSVASLHRPPEEALLLGNLVAFVIEPNRSLLLKYLGKHAEASSIYSFAFAAPSRLKFKAGQYMEWTLPHTGLDARGNRRYLTIASSPTEKNLMFTVKIPEAHSKYKESLLRLEPGQKIAAQRLAGSFVLPETDRKVAFIAGGVGITPFRSIVKNLVDSQRQLDAVLLYSIKTADEIAFAHLFSEAQPLGLKTKYILSEGSDANYLHGFINKNLIKTEVKDHQDRLFYISGPQGFVAAVRLALLELDVPAGHITTDFFPGYN